MKVIDNNELLQQVRSPTFDWTYYKLPLIYQIYNNNLEIRNDFELKLLVEAIRNFEQEVNN